MSRFYGKGVSKAVSLINNELKEEADILAKENVKRANIFSRLFRSLNYLVWGDV